MLTAAAREESLTRKTGLYRLEVRDENGELIALAEGLGLPPGITCPGFRAGAHSGISN